MSKCAKIEPMVKMVLETNKEARGNDFILIYDVYKEIIPDIDKMSFENIIFNHKEYKMPCFESITRARRKLQAKHHDLLPDEDIKIAREVEQMSYMDYAIN